MIRTSQSGFTVIEGLLIVAILAIVGGTGYYVYHSKQTADKNLNSAQSETSVVKVTKKTNSPTSTAKPTTFVFGELGAQMTVPDSLKGLSYIDIKGTSVTGAPQTFLYVTSDDFKAFLKSCNATTSGTDAYFAALDKGSNAVYPATPTPDNTDGTLIKQFDGYYIEGSADQQSNPCAGDSSSAALEKERATLFQDLSDALKAATPFGI